MQLNLLEYLEHSVARVPDKTAFADEFKRLTFGELLYLARRLGTSLARRLAQPNQPIVLLAERRVLTIVGMQGILVSGNYYAPLDPHMPAARMTAILTQIQPALLLCAAEDRPLAERLLVDYQAANALARAKPPAGIKSPAGTESPAETVPLVGATPPAVCAVLTIEEGMVEPVDDALLAARRAAVLDSDPAYLIFTSGSTGTPKGIVVAHRSVIDFTDWLAAFCGLTETDVLGNQAPFYFDLSVKDIYGTLCCGASCEIVPRRCYVFPAVLLGYLRDKQITALLWATSAFHLVANSGALESLAAAGTLPATLRLAALGGEALQARAVNRWRAVLPDLAIYNLYGPTEATVDCIAYRLDRAFTDDETIPIGTACRNKAILLLDEQGQPVPDGTPGQIVVRGTGLARGYFRDPDKTAAAFVQNPQHDRYPDPVYCTGDIAVRGTDGLLRFLSRQDDQIKHMGYRIELGEIETALASLPQVEAAVCLYDAARDKIHCVYAGTGDRNTLAVALRSLLPKYMLPNCYHQRDALPLNPNGKIDRVQLRATYLESPAPGEKSQ